MFQEFIKVCKSFKIKSEKFSLFSHSGGDDKCTLTTSPKSKNFGSGTPQRNKRKNKAYNAFIGESPCNPYPSEEVKDVIHILVVKFKTIRIFCDVN